MNRERQHLIIVPEDDGIRQVAVGFESRCDAGRQLQVRPPAGGWPNVLSLLEGPLRKHLEAYGQAHLLLAIDFDNIEPERRLRFQQATSPTIAARVYLLGAAGEVEDLRRGLGWGSLNAIGQRIAQACRANDTDLWAPPSLAHNREMVKRIRSDLGTLLFR